MKKLLASLVVVLTVTGMAMASVSFSVPALTEATAGSSVVIPVTAVGTDPIAGMTLSLTVGAPLEITGLDVLTGTVFATNANPPTILLNSTNPDEIPAPQYAVADLLTQSGTVNTPGLLASVTVFVPAGTPDGNYDILTWIPDVQGSNFAGATLGTMGQGLIHVPEPTAALLLVAGLPLIRRRRA